MPRPDPRRGLGCLDWTGGGPTAGGGGGAGRGMRTVFVGESVRTR